MKSIVAVGLLLVVVSYGCGSVPSSPVTPVAESDGRNDSEFSAAPVELDSGPMVGHVSTNRVQLWARASGVGELWARLQELDDDGKPRAATAAERVRAREQHDFCVEWRFDGLRPATRYRYHISRSPPAGDSIGDGDSLASGDIRTAPPTDAVTTTRIALGSCADLGEGTAKSWRRLQQEPIDALVLLGDTPYIDSFDLTKQRQCHREFSRVDAFRELVRRVPCYSTWDDHDFGGNDCDGRHPGKVNSRRAFMEYRSNPSYGEDGRGIYTSFRRGPFEVFLLDTRSFAATEPSPFETHAASLLGEAQWEWLLEGLESSTAPVKVLACGMIWNQAVRPGKRDHWGSYLHERDALFEHISEHDIGGVVLVGGDIHRSRALRHDSESVDYPILELISSPLHHRVIQRADQPHPGLLKDLGEPHCFLMLEAEVSPEGVTSARALFINAEGNRLFDLDLTTAE